MYGKVLLRSAARVFMFRGWMLSFFLLLFVSPYAHGATETVTFATQPALATGVEPYCVAIADFNGDGFLDIAVPNYDPGSAGSTVSVFLGKGDGTFQPAANYGVGPTPHYIATGDFNGDGVPDIVVAQGGSAISVLLGRGDGGFETAANYFVGDSQASLAVADLNGDGKPDVVVANTSGGRNGKGYVVVLLGNGDGTLQRGKTYRAGNIPTNLAAADFNGDGIPDLAITSGGGQKAFQVLINNGDGSFQFPVNTYLGGSPESIMSADFNADGKMDLAIGVANSLGGSASVFLGNGDGTFQRSISFSTVPSPISIQAQDFTRDGFLDLVVADQSGGSSGAGGVSVLLGKGTGNFEAPASYSAGANPIFVAAGDFNGDGYPDLAVADTPTNSVTVLLNVPTPIVTVSPSNLAFGTVVAGTVSVSQPVHVNNSGDAPLGITSLSVSSGFLATSFCGSSVAAGTTCRIQVSFSPSGAGLWTGTLTLADNATGSPQVVTLTGTGTFLGLSPATLDFGTVAVGATSPPQMVTVSNVSTKAIALSSVAIGGINPGDYAVSNSCPGSLGAKSSCSVSVTFTPARTGARSATLNVSESVGGSVQTSSVALSGTGQ